MENDDKANVSSTRIRITLDPYVSFYNEEIWILNFKLWSDFNSVERVYIPCPRASAIHRVKLSRNWWLVAGEARKKKKGEKKQDEETRRKRRAQGRDGMRRGLDTRP